MTGVKTCALPIIFFFFFFFSNNYDLSALGTLFTDVKFKMYVGLNVVSVNHCSRGCNKAAHVSCEWSLYEEWLL